MLSVFAALAIRSPESAVGRLSDWRPVVVSDEVRVDVEKVPPTELAGVGYIAGEPLRVRLRWALLAREVSPAAWDRGVRTTVDVLEIDCPSSSSRTLTTRAFGADGSAIPEASLATTSPAWRRHAPASVGGLVVAALCRTSEQAAHAA